MDNHILSGTLFIVRIAYTEPNLATGTDTPVTVGVCILAKRDDFESVLAFVRENSQSIISALATDPTTLVQRHKGPYQIDQIERLTSKVFTTDEVLDLDSDESPHVITLEGRANPGEVETETSSRT